MPHRDTVRAPTIVPLAVPIPGYPTTHILQKTCIELQTASPNCRIYFTTDGTDPDPFKTGIKGPGQTFRFKKPFKLKQGTRTVRAVAVHINRRDQSAIASKTFTVGEDDSLQNTGEMAGNPFLRNGYTSLDLDNYTGETYGAPVSGEYSLEDDSLEKYFTGRNGRVEDLYLSGDSDLETEVSNFFNAGIRDGRKSRRSHRDAVHSPISSTGDGLTDLYIADLEMTPRHAYGNRISYPSDLETYRSSNTVRFAEPETDIDHYSPAHSEFTRVSSLPDQTPSLYLGSEHSRGSPTPRHQPQEFSPNGHTASTDAFHPGQRSAREYSPLRNYSPTQVVPGPHLDYSAARGYNIDRHHHTSSYGQQDHYPAITPRLRSEYDRQVQEELAKLRAERQQQQRYSIAHNGYIAERERERQEFALHSRGRSRSPSPLRALSPSRYSTNLHPNPFGHRNGYTEQLFEVHRERHSRADERDEILRRRRERQLWEHQEAKRLEQSGRVEEEERFEEKYEDEAKEKQDVPEKGPTKKESHTKLDKKDKKKNKKAKKKKVPTATLR